MKEGGISFIYTLVVQIQIQIPDICLHRGVHWATPLLRYRWEDKFWKCWLSGKK